MRTATGPWLVAAAVLWLAGTTFAQTPVDAAAAPVVQALMSRELAGVAGKQVQMMTVTYPPGGRSAPHRHHAQVFVYVLSGSLHMQVSGGPLLTLTAGQTFYEGPEDVHTISENASRTEAATFLVFMIKEKPDAH